MFTQRSTFTRLGALLGAIGSTLFATSDAKAQNSGNQGYWHVGLELGELPFHGSFKPGISIGYHFNDLVYVGFVYQLADSIERDGTSFNAQATSLAGLTTSSETVGQRAYLQARIRPHRLAPYVSIGLVFNDRDTETMTFDAREREIGGETVTGPLTLRQSRPFGLRPAIGLGYSFRFDNGIELFSEWSGWWMFGAPKPEVDIDAPGLSATARDVLAQRIHKAFIASPFNSYHVFQLGAGYTF